QVGDRAFTAGVEYRIPLARVERGIRVLPIYFARVTGDVFGDVGAAWCPGPGPNPLASIASSPDPIASVGAEVIAEFRVGYNTSVPLRLGVAQPLERGRRPRFHLRVDRSF